MTAAIVQSGFNNADTSNSVTLGAAPTNGNLLVAVLMHFQNNPGTASGWTNLFIHNAATDEGVSVFYKYAGAGESATQTFATGGAQRAAVMWEISGLTGTWGTDYQQRKDEVDLTASPSFNTTAFNTSANNTMILAVLFGNTALATTETGAPTITNGNSPSVDQSFLYNGISNRHGAFTAIHDFFASSGTSVHHTATFPINQSTGGYVELAFNWTALATTVTLGLASETDSALALSAPTQSVALGLATETDSVFSLGPPSQSVALGLAEETETALPLTWSRLLYWPFDDLKPRHIGIYPIAATIGGGVALTNKEPAIDSGAGFWKIEYGSVPLMTRAKILKWRELEAKAEGRGQIIAVPIYDGKRAPWPGAPGGAIDVAANADAAVGDTALEVLVNDAGTLAIGQHFSADSRLYRIKSVSDLGAGVLSLGIWPKLRAIIRSGDALEFRRPLCRVRLATDDAMALDLSLLKFGDPSVTFVEAL